MPNKKGNELERMTWIVTSLRYIEGYAEESVVTGDVLDFYLFEEPFAKEHVICILAVLKAALAMKQLREVNSNR